MSGLLDVVVDRVGDIGGSDVLGDKVVVERRVCWDVGVDGILG